jgi:hypothetical protein
MILICTLIVKADENLENILLEFVLCCNHVGMYVFEQEHVSFHENNTSCLHATQLYPDHHLLIVKT